MPVNRTGIITGQKIRVVKRQRALDMRRSPTPAEKLLWQQLRRGKLHGLHFRRQQNIDGFIADFYCHAAGVILEVDGGVHQNRREYDTERDRIITGRGLLVIRIANDDIEQELDKVLQKIGHICLARSKRINRP